MHSVRRLLMVAGTIMALVGAVPTASADSPRSGDLHLTKDCHGYTGLAGSSCVITSSSLQAIPVGSRVVYASALGATAVDSDVTLVAGPGNSAFGHCSFDLVKMVGGCSFLGGTGTFTRFHASLDTTFLAPKVWHLDGTYWFGAWGRDHDIAHNTFTKWVTALPLLPGDVADMAGIVGGEVGQGSFAGTVLRKVVGPTTSIEALYHFNGSSHSFTALVHVEQTGLNAVIVGVVTDGWLKGSMVNGAYAQITCAQGLNGTCFQGTLDLSGEPRD
jgi:hypothetical protein